MMFGPEGKQVAVNEKLFEVLTFYSKRCTIRKFDNVFIVDGKEGYGKTSFTANACYIMSIITGRPYTIENIFFDPHKMKDFAKTTKEQIIHWDEAALAGLSSEWQSKIQRELVKMLMICRKKRHIFFFCIPRFKRLKEDLIERADSMFRVYSRDKITLGRFAYYSEPKLEALYDDFKRTRKVHYKRFFNWCGTFPDFPSHIISEEEYDKKKDEAIENFDKDTEKEKVNTKLITLQYKLSEYSKKLKEKYGITHVEITDGMGIGKNMLTEWQKIPLKYPEIVEE